MWQYIKFKITKEFYLYREKYPKSNIGLSMGIFCLHQQIEAKLFSKGGLHNFVNLEGTSCNHHKPQGMFVILSLIF